MAVGEAGVVTVNPQFERPLPLPSPSRDRQRALARYVRAVTLVIGLGLIAWAADSVFWSNRVQQAMQVQQGGRHADPHGRK